jgi:hypothetical protein
MRLRWFVAILAPIALAGCGGGAPVETAEPKTPERTVTLREVKAPDLGNPGNLALIRGRDKLKVGDEWEFAKKIFLQQRGAYEINELPPELTGADYRARGWEAPAEGFGAILYKDRVALAMYRIEHVDEDRVQEFVSTYRDYFGKPNDTVPPELAEMTHDRARKVRSRYWFWQQGSQRLMISSVTTLADGTNVSIAVGDGNTMDALGMSVSAAKSDQAKAERALEQQQQVQSGN